jgi:hypothetical protein
MSFRKSYHEVGILVLRVLDSVDRALRCIYVRPIFGAPVTAKKNNLLKQWELGTQRVLRAVRVERGILQRPLSRQLGRAENYVTLIETGQRKCTVAEACEIAHALGDDPADVLARIARYKS